MKKEYINPYIETSELFFGGVLMGSPELPGGGGPSGGSIGGGSAPKRKVF